MYSMCTNDSLDHVDSVFAHLVGECKDVDNTFGVSLIKQAVQSYERSSAANTGTDNQRHDTLSVKQLGRHLMQETTIMWLYWWLTVSNRRTCMTCWIYTLMSRMSEKQKLLQNKYSLYTLYIGWMASYPANLSHPSFASMIVGWMVQYFRVATHSNHHTFTITSLSSQHS